jgi:vacuolar-type H+-ATPase subunit E/Vma4
MCRNVGSDLMTDKERGSQSGRLLQGIMEQADEESKKIVDDAEMQAKEIVEGASRKADSIRREAEGRVERQSEEIRRKYRQLTETEQRKARLSVQEHLFNLAMEKVRDGMAALREQGGYVEVLKDWIVEGALGLARDTLQVNASKDERSLLTDGVLKDCEKTIKEVGGRSVELELSSGPPTERQGVFLSAGNGRLAYNNLVEARMQRYSMEIRRMIYRRIQSEKIESE